MSAASGSCALDSMEVDTAGIDAVLAVVLSYNGAPFAGFARQPGKFTVQGDVERAASMALRRPVEVVCAGRTDAGVHARGQVVSFPVRRDELDGRKLQKLRRSLQALTDDAISIRSIAVMPPGFSARFSAVSREYRYLVAPGDRTPLFLRDWCWDVKRDLDVDAMGRAAQHLVGEHDFKSFCMAASAAGRNTVRTVERIEVRRVSVLGEDAVSIRVVGNAFLHSMVRSIVGTLVAVGSGRRPPEWVAEVLAARDRRMAGENAPAAGLVFWRVSYRGGVPCYEHDALAAEEGAYRLPPVADAPAELPGVSAQDVAVAEAVMGALEEDAAAGDDPGGLPEDAAVARPGSDAFFEAAMRADLPDAVMAAAGRPAAGGMRVNDVDGPAVAAAPRTRRVAPADPRPAEGEVSLSFEVPRESAAARAAKRQGGRKKGLFSSLFEKPGKGGRDGQGA